MTADPCNHPAGTDDLEVRLARFGLPAHACRLYRTPDGQPEARWLRGCIAALPRDYREVLVLRELEELTYKEIGAIVGVPLGTVMSRLSRARDLLQQRMLAGRARKTS